MQSTYETFVIRFRKFVMVGGVNVFGVLMALLAAEGTARLAGLEARRAKGGDRALWRYESLRGWGLIPGASGSDNRGGPDPGSVRVNGQGFRGPSFARTKGRTTSRILMLGDSFGFGVGVDEPHIVSSRLADLVNADHELTRGNRVDVLNLSISGYSTDQEILTFEAEGAPLDPDVVVLLMCDNDFEGNMQGFAYSRYYKPRFLLEGDSLRLVDTPVPRAERRRPVRTWLFDHSALLSGLVALINRPRLRRLERMLSPGEAARSSGSPEELMVALLRKLDREVTQIGARLVTFNTGHRGEKTPLFQAIRPTLEQAGIAHLGLEGPLGDARKRHPERKWDFDSDTHWNADSHDLAARIMHLHLRKLAREGKVRLSH
jgi:hypothetical protein